MNDLYNKHFLKISNFTKSQIEKIINLSIVLKKLKKKKKETKYLKNKKIALIFEQKSTRTRCSFEVSSYDQGANISYLNTEDLHLGYKESIIDTVKILERIYDGIAYRGNNHNIIKILSNNSKIPIWNGLTKKYHPTQILADILTIIENTKKKISDIIIAYVGDASNNIANSILEASNIMNFQLRFLAPKTLFPNKKLLKKSKNKILCTEDIKLGINKVDFIYTDTWISLNDKKDIWDKKISLLKKYQINEHMLKLTNNNNTKVLHCLPAFHDQNTILGKKIAKKYKLYNGIEITDPVFQKNSNIIFEQSENKLHTIKALMILTLLKTI